MRELTAIGRLGLCGFVLALAVAAAPAQQQTQGGAKSTDAAKPTPPADAAKGVPAGVNPATYSIGAEDVLRIDVWQDQHLSGPVTVRPDGKVTIALIGDVQASGLTPAQLTDSIKEKLKEFIPDANVTVSVMEVNSKKYYIQGQVLKPGQFPLVVPTTVLDALANAGGFQAFADTKHITIFRDGGKETLKFNYNDVTKGKHLEQNVLLENGDHIIVK